MDVKDDSVILFFDKNRRHDWIGNDSKNAIKRKD